MIAATANPRSASATSTRGLLSSVVVIIVFLVEHFAANLYNLYLLTKNTYVYGCGQRPFACCRRCIVRLPTLKHFVANAAPLIVFFFTGVRIMLPLLLLQTAKF